MLHTVPPTMDAEQQLCQSPYRIACGTPCTDWSCITALVNGASTRVISEMSVRLRSPRSDGCPVHGVHVRHSVVRFHRGRASGVLNTSEEKLRKMG